MSKPTLAPSRTVTRSANRIQLTGSTQYSQFEEEAINTSRFRFSIRTLLLLVLHSSLILGVFVIILRLKAFKLEPLIRDFQRAFITWPGVVVVLPAMGAGFAPLVGPVLFLVVLIRQCFYSPRLVSGWYFILFALSIPLWALCSVTGGGVELEFRTRMAIVLLVVAIASVVEAARRGPDETTPPPVKRVYSGDVAVLMRPPKTFPEQYITSLLIALCAILFACFVVAFEVLLWI